LVELLYFLGGKSWGNLEFFEEIFVNFLGYFLYFKGKKFKKISSKNKNLATLFLHEKALKKTKIGPKIKN
jgi:hypothetical protein